MVKTVRERGYAFRDPKVEPRTSDTLAVPIYVDGVVLGSLGITYFRSAINSFGDRQSLVTELTGAAKAIDAGVRRLSGLLSS